MATMPSYSSRQVPAMYNMSGQPTASVAHLHATAPTMMHSSTAPFLYNAPLVNNLGQSTSAPPTPMPIATLHSTPTTMYDSSSLLSPTLMGNYLSATLGQDNILQGTLASSRGSGLNVVPKRLKINWIAPMQTTGFNTVMPATELDDHPYDVIIRMTMKMPAMPRSSLLLNGQSELG